MLIIAVSMAIVPLASVAHSEPTIEYWTKQGYSSNLLESPEPLSGPFWEGSLKLKGTIGQDGAKLSYGIYQKELRTGAYRFGDTHETGFNLGYAQQLGKDTVLELETSYIRNSSGDVFLQLPGNIIGYRAVDSAVQAGGKITTTAFGGKTAFTAKIAELRKGDAHFTIDLLKPAKLDPDVGLLTLGVNHYASAKGGELCFCLEYNQSMINKDEQAIYSRFPASTLRGSLAYGKEFGAGLSLIAEAGIIVLSSDDLSHGNRQSRPYLRGEAKWTTFADLEFAAAYKHDIAIGDIDDALAEIVDSYKISVSRQLNPWAKITLAYSRTESEYIYYVYDRTTRNVSAKLTLGQEKSPQFEIGYAHVKQTEADPSANYKGSEITARVSGSF
ncbi:hypothetical protein [Rhizobium herbae]|uniref:Porin n=1 Tax=Rhizobium herbae TaxID=508661 RepID=A0ABS4EMJ4_9HYPH|nr:hypothetical protein [Rhizobium herbae]MBP1859156.1 hypothetical protein [Rhizobium herbae]